MQPSANVLVEIDNLGPINRGVDEAHRIAFRAAKVGADVMPVPVGQIAQPQPAVVVAPLRTFWPDAKDQDCLEANIPFYAVSAANQRAGFGAKACRIKGDRAPSRIAPPVAIGTYPDTAGSGCGEVGQRIDTGVALRGRLPKRETWPRSTLARRYQADLGRYPVERYRSQIRWCVERRT